MRTRSISIWVCVLLAPWHWRAQAQDRDENLLSGPDTHEHAQRDGGHLLGDWGGRRSRWLEKGVSLDLQYRSDSLWNLRSKQKTRLAEWSRVRGTLDIDFGRLNDHPGWYFHMTALWQGGGNLGQYLGLVAGPSGMASANTFRLDSWWIERRFRADRVAIRAGQFAGQDFYGAQHFGSSFIFEPMGYALGNLSNTHETFDPPSTPAVELRVVPFEHLYVKSMVMAGDPDPYAHNPTGLVPQFRGSPVSVSEIGFTPGQKAVSVRAFDTVESRKAFSGLYQFGAAYNPGPFQVGGSSRKESGNYLLYGMANQALWRSGGKGVDATAAYDWSPSRQNRQNRQLTAGVRLNEPLRSRRHNSIAFGYVRSFFSRAWADAPAHSEQAVECNLLFEVVPMVVLQPVVQVYVNAGGSGRSAVVFGFRTRIDL